MDVMPRGSRGGRRRRWLVLLGIGCLALLGLAQPVSAHAGALSGSLTSVPIPSWLVIVTGGGVIGASFLFAALVTDHESIRTVNALALRLTGWARGFSGRSLARVGQAGGVLLLVLVLTSGLIGPRAATDSFAVLFVWAGWWAGYPMTVYLVGNTWTGLNPWRGLAALLPDRSRWTVSDDTAVWISSIGLLGLVWLEVVSPVAENPRLLAGVVLAYTVVALGGILAVGRETWFERIDPVSGVFRTYGRMAPVRRTDDGIELSLPGSALAAGRTGEDLATPFIIALLWATTFDGLVATPGWETVAGVLVGIGLPAHLLYLVTVALGFFLFLKAFQLATQYARRTGNTYVTAEEIGGWIAPSLVPIAAGYHLAHFLGYFISLSPALLASLSNPLGAAQATTAILIPGWFGSLQLLFVVIGHMLAVWIAHSRAFELFPGRLQPIRSQYPLIVVMIAYTVISLWIVSQPFGSAPFV